MELANVVVWNTIAVKEVQPPSKISTKHVEFKNSILFKITELHKYECNVEYTILLICTEAVTSPHHELNKVITNSKNLHKISRVQTFGTNLGKYTK